MVEKKDNCSSIYIISFLIVISAFTSSKAQNSSWDGPVPLTLPLPPQTEKYFSSYTTVLQADKNAAEWWAGAPSVVIDKNGIFWMAARMRSPEHPVGLRGYEIRLLRSKDGIHFEEIKKINRSELPIPGFERPALTIDPITGKFKLYVCGPWQGGPWCILKFDDVENLTDINPASVGPVIQAPEQRYARDVSVKEYKDPVIIYAHNQWHCYVIGYIRQNERIFHFVSDDGEKWHAYGDVNAPIMDLAGWHNFFVRPASVIPLGIGFLFVYEGSNTQWYDPVYNVVTGLGFTFDLHNILDLSPKAPIIKSSTETDFSTWRYSHWLLHNNEFWIYAEVATANQSHEIRLFRLPLHH
ncbi:MAG: hypothetical protein JJU28_16440 [Cyclobacteriaceae bacterium]|nr:hypothetical protein [Cyclobacteriaceae bacterium]